MQGRNVAGRLTPTQQKLLDSRIKGRAAGPQCVPRIACRPTKESAPLSFSQDRLWFLDQLQPGDAAYNMLALVKFHGSFDQEVLEQVVSEMVRRHETLRTHFEERDGQPMQIIETARPFRLQADEIVAAENLADDEIASLVRREGARPFDLRTGPLVRIRIFRRSEQEHLIAMIMHHIISDGWSMRILGEEIRSLYIAYSAGLPSPLAEMSIQYGDYASWQRSQLGGELLDRQIEYWKRTLTDLPSLELPTDRLRPPLQTSRGASARIEIPPALTQQLADLSRGQRTTMFMILLAGFNVLLSSWTSQTDIVVGTPIAGRTDPLVERLVGFFVNNLVLRTDMSGDPTFVEVLKRVRDVALGAFTHQDLPFERLVEAVKPVRDLSRSPLFQVLVNSHELETSSTRQSDGVFEVEEELLSSEQTNSKFDLNFYLKQREGAVRVTLVYNLDLFRPETIEQLLRRYLSILGLAVQRPEARLSDLDLLSDADRECLFGKWNQTVSEYPRESLLHELFLAQAGRTPEAIAVVSGTEALTYRELAERSAAVARRLGQLGVGEENIVGVCADHSADMIVGLLGVLQAGAAYLPLDPDYPRQRIDYLLDSTRAGIVVAADRHAQVFAGAAQLVSPIDLDAGLPASAERRVWKANARQLAYVIFTSGSTGAPKGVMVEHRQVINYVFGARKDLSLARCRHFAMLQSLTVGSAITVLYPSLLSGASLHVIDRNTALDAEAFAAYVSKHRIDCIKIAPSHLQALLTAAHCPANLLSDAVIVAGEPLSAGLADRVRALKPDIHLFNHYGTTETTIGVLTTPVDEGASVRYAVLPLGRPLPNSRIYVLNEHMRPVPVGAVGGIYVAGESVTRGYLAAPGLTASRYLPSPFDLDGPGARLYRTGDVGRWLDDGVVQFLGRADDQIKVRGFRVELGEIEAVLLSHPAVQQARVLAQTLPASSTQLVAYVAHGKDVEVDIGELAEYLRSRLPEYMVPARYKLVSELPRTQHGKVDRKALLAGMIDAVAVRTEYVAPRTQLEQRLESMWTDVLRIERVGANDNFFDLGGHSLLATRLIARIREEFGIALPLRKVFDAPTISGLARLLAETDEEETIVIKVGV